MCQFETRMLRDRRHSWTSELDRWLAGFLIQFASLRYLLLLYLLGGTVVVWHLIPWMALELDFFEVFGRFESIPVAGVSSSCQAEMNVDVAVDAGLWRPEEFKQQDSVGVCSGAVKV